MTQSMKRWMLAAVIAAAMVIASGGMGAAVTIALDGDDADFESARHIEKAHSQLSKAELKLDQ